MTDFRLSFEERIKPIRALAEKYPKDIFVQHRYQDAFRHRGHLYQEFDRAFMLYRSKADDSLFRYFEARLLASFNPKKAEPMLEELIAQEAGFPWPHLVIIELTMRPGARDAKKAEAHLRSFLRVCPSALEPYRLMGTIEDPSMIAEGAKRLRTLRETHTDSWFLPYWCQLWNLELRAAPKEDQEQVRQRVMKDLAPIQQLSPSPTGSWYGVLKCGANLVKAQSILDSLDETILREFPDSSLALEVEGSHWEREHPQPGRDASAEAQKAHMELEKSRTEELLKRWPDDPGLLMERWEQISDESTSLSLDERLSIADKIVSLRHRSPDYSFSVPPLSIRLAELYVKWRVRLDQVPELIQAGLRDVELEKKYQMDPSAFPQEMQNRWVDWVAITNERARFILVDLYLHQKLPEKARDVIQLELESLEQKSSVQPQSDLDKRKAEAQRWQWLRYQARVAELHGKPDEALSIYQQFVQRYPSQYLSDTSRMRQETKDLLADIKRVYLASGRKEESWSEWLMAGAKRDLPKAELPKETPALPYTFILPDFEAKDLNGKMWRLADLKGKATFVDIWATGAGPAGVNIPNCKSSSMPSKIARTSKCSRSAWMKANTWQSPT